MTRGRGGLPGILVGIGPEEAARKALIKVLRDVLGSDRAETVRLVLSPDAAGHLLVHEAAVPICSSSEVTAMVVELLPVRCWAQ